MEVSNNLPPVTPLLNQAQGAIPADMDSGDAQALARVAEDFESLFFSLLLKEMRQTLEPGTLFGRDSGDTYGSLFDLFLGQHLARTGRLGIARLIQSRIGCVDGPGSPEKASPEASNDNELSA